MIYPDVSFATFLERPNRFIARVVPDGEAEAVTVHVKNTGRCRELLVPGCRVVLARAQNPVRKTPYDLIGVYKGSSPEDPSGPAIAAAHPQGWLYNIDSQVPNTVVGEWLAAHAGEQAFSRIRPEHRFGNSRVDFYAERPMVTPGGTAASDDTAAASDDTAVAPNGATTDAVERFLIEVKGCTLEREGIGYFPDAPTERGAKHLRELAAAAQAGYTCAVAFVIQMEGVDEVRPNTATDPAFAEAWVAAEAAGVRFLHLTCAVTPDSLRITSPCCL